MGEIREREEGGGGQGPGLRKIDEEEQDLQVWLNSDVSISFFGCITHSQKLSQPSDDPVEYSE